MRIGIGVTLAIATVAALLGTPARVVAQGAAARPDPPAQPSGMQVTEIENGWLVAPDVKITRVNDRAATFAGGYGGWVTGGTFLVGGGGYWLANNSSHFRMAYGGLVLEWLARSDRRIGFGARTLVGGGRATVGLSYADLLGDIAPVAFAGAPIRFGRHDVRVRPGANPVDLTEQSWRVSENFLVAEPQANLLLTVTPWMRINAGVGYRLIGGTSILDERLDGASGTLAIQFGGGP